MSLSLVEGRDDLGLPNTLGGIAAAARVEPAELKALEVAPYRPDLDMEERPERDPRMPNPTKLLEDDLRNGGFDLQLSLALRNGEREKILLNESDAKAWFGMRATAKAEFANRRIYERRMAVALEAAMDLKRRGLPPESRNLRPDQEAALREFDMIVEKLVARPPDHEKGGFDKVLSLREGLSRAIDSGKAKALRRRALEGRTSLKRLREDIADFFAGDSDYNQAIGSYSTPSQYEYLPVGGPMLEQQLITDVWDTLSRTWYAWTHDPIIKRGCSLLKNFVLGRGVNILCNDDKVQVVVDAFIDREHFQRKLRQYVVSLARDGEVFVRKIRSGDGTIKIRVQHPMTIWEIVTDAEDVEAIYWYVQRYQTRFVQYAQSLPAARCRWIERTILPEDMCWVKINDSPTDVRGRSDVFAVLVWAKRLRDFFDALVQKEQASAAYQWHYQVKGGQADVTRISNAIGTGQAPPPGSSFVTNDAVTVMSVSSDKRASGTGQGSTYEGLLNHIANGFGFSKDYFGAANRNSRASALVANEPSTKNVEDFQDVVGDDLIVPLIRDVIDEARKYGQLDGVTDFGFRVGFPSISKSDSQTRVQMLALGEAMAWWSKETAANEGAGEVEIDDYDFDEEQKTLKAEGVEDSLLMIARTYEQVKKGLPSPEDVAFPPSLVPDPAFAGSGGGALPSNGQPAALQPGASADGRYASPTSAAGGASIQRDEKRAREAAIREAVTRGAIVIIP